MLAWSRSPKAKHRCFYCGKKFGERKSDRRTSDHILPKHRHRGFAHNIARACYGCNQAKGAKSITLWRIEFKRRNAQQGYPDLEIFYCEEVVNRFFPDDDISLNGGQAFYFDDLFEIFQGNAYKAINRFDSPALIERLERISRGG
jgi:hypothetical protein